MRAKRFKKRLRSNGSLKGGFLWLVLWVSPEPAFFMGNTRQYNNLSKVEFVHHELNEVVDPDFVKELHKMVAHKLFTLWLEERKRNEIVKLEVKKAA